MKSKLLFIFCWIIMSWLKPDPVFAGDACLPEDCHETREVDTASSCEPNELRTFCVQKYGIYNVPCDSECRYDRKPVADTEECDANATVYYNCPGHTQIIGPGTCCEDDVGTVDPDGCATQPPTNPSVDCNYSSTQIKFSWLPSVTPGDSQVVMVSDDYTAIFNNCGGISYSDPKCIYKLTGLPVTQKYVLLDKTRFDADKIYYYKVLNYLTPLNCVKSAQTYTNCSACPQTKPTNLAVNCNYSANQLQLTWTKGIGPSVKQRVFISTDRTDVVNNCVAPAVCTVENNNVPANQESYLLYKAPLDLTYYWKVINVPGIPCNQQESIIPLFNCFSCDTGTPANLAADWENAAYPTRVVLTWTPGGGVASTGQRVLVSDNRTAIDYDCNGAYASHCEVNYTTTNKNLAVYRPLKSLFDDGKIYYFKVINTGDPASCTQESAVLTTMSSCAPDPAAMDDLSIGQTRNLQVSAVTNAVITRINFSSAAVGIASVSPGYVLGAPYVTGVKGVSVGSTNISYDVKVGTATVCSDSLPVTVINPNVYAWWQTDGGSVHAGGQIRSLIPSTCIGACKPYLITGTAGLLSSNGTVNLSSGDIAENGTDWNAQTVYRGTQTNYAYFERILADDPAGVGAWTTTLPATNGVFKATGNVTTSGTWNLGSSRKVVLLVNGTVTINQPIDVAVGGFLAIIASGDIIIADSVGRVEGVFVANRYLATNDTSSTPLVGEGVFVAWNRILLRRNLADNTLTPAEKFIYRPDLVLNAYEYLKWLDISWQEVAP